MIRLYVLICRGKLVWLHSAVKIKMVLSTRKVDKESRLCQGSENNLTFGINDENNSLLAALF